VIRKDIIVFIGYMLLIAIPPLVFWFILLHYFVMIDLMDMFIGFMDFLRSLPF